MKSNCCDAHIGVSNVFESDEGTCHYVCSECAEACDVHEDKPEEPVPCHRSCDYIRQLEAERSQFATRYRETHKLFMEGYEENAALKAENERLKWDLSLLESDTIALCGQNVSKLIEECEKLRAREVELVAYVIAKNWGAKPTVEFVEKTIAEFEAQEGK